MDCRTIEKYKQSLIELTNNCMLTPGAAYYIAKDFLRDLERAYSEALQYEKQLAEKGELETTETETIGSPYDANKNYDFKEIE